MGGQAILINYSADSAAAKRQREQKGLLLDSRARFSNTGCLHIHAAHTKEKFGPRERSKYAGGHSKKSGSRGGKN